jgi:ribosomal protein S12 methylthiotransferase
MRIVHGICMPAADPGTSFVSLGCPEALIDSEHILTRLKAEGYAIVPRCDKTDAFVVSTYGFIDTAVQERACARSPP